MKKPTLLIVDDDESIRLILANALAELDVTLIEAEDGFHALQVLNKQTADILIADHKMPGMTGLALLSEVKKLYPDITRLLMTGYLEADIFKEAINIGEIYKIITKPFKIFELRNIVKQAIDFHIANVINKEFIEKLEHEVKLFFQSFLNSGQAIIITDKDLRIKYTNQAFNKLYGYDLNEVMDEYLIEILIEPQEKPGFQTVIESIINRDNEYWSGDMMNCGRDGDKIPVINSIIPLRDIENTITNFLFMSTDMTSRKNLENKLRKSEKKYRRIIQNAAEGIFQSNIEGRFLMVNPAFKSLFLIPSTKELKKNYTFTDLFYRTEDAEKIIEMLKNEQWLINTEMRLRRSNGEEFNGSFNLHLVRSKQKKPLYIQGFVRDVSAEMQMRELSERMQRLEALGQLSAGLAHEIKNPIASLQLNMQFLQRKYENDAFFQENVDEVFEAINRVEKIMEQTLYFAGKKQPTLVHENITELLERSIDLIKLEFDNPDIDFILNCPADFPQLLLDKDQFLQVMVNLLKNGIQAIENEGTITIDCSIKTINQLNRAVVSVEDTGTGITEEECRKIFNPFYTTKSTGIGLGLSIIQKIMDLHNASIEVTSEKGNGTKFTLLFPIPE